MEMAYLPRSAVETIFLELHNIYFESIGKDLSSKEFVKRIFGIFSENLQKKVIA